MHLFSEAFVSDLVSVVFDGVIVHDGTVITDANKRAAGIFGYESAESMVGLPYHVLLAPSGRRATELRVSSGTEGRYNALCRRRDGIEFTIDVNTREITFHGSRLRIVAFRYSAGEQAPFGESLIQRSLALDQTVKALATTIEQRDAFTAGHQTRVSALAMRVAGELDMSDREITTIRIAGNIHDIGKIAVPAEILMKPSALSQEEYDLVKLHPTAGSAIINSVDFDGPVRQTILQHHERLDGSGYPDGVADLIPEARVIAVADVYDALTSSRPYRAGMTPANALDLMSEHECRGLDGDALQTLSTLVQSN
ncbi:MAG: HD domain-containing protein [Gammaproteobacteria bacterium]|nr:HD domain-containing protein [Gammaproteobacteria bacterium]